MESSSALRLDLPLAGMTCAVVDYDPGKVGVEQLERSVEEAGFEVAS